MGSFFAQFAATLPQRRRRGVLSWSALGLAALMACSGCQALVPSALPSGLALGEDARIARQAKADSFPSPADVGLEESKVR